MQFWTKVVKQQTDIRLRVSQAGGIIMVAGLLYSLVLENQGEPVDLAAVVTLAGLATVIIGWILRRGKAVHPLVTETDIIIDTNKIKIGDQSYEVAQVEYLDFLVNSYAGMKGPRIRYRRIILDGKDNTLYFTADGKRHAYRFYLEDSMAMQRLGMLFREFYRERVRFRERNRGGRTFLFEQVHDRQAFERAKKMEGYE
jgi:hypothetical protein